MGAHVLRVHGPHARLQGVVHGHARRRPRLVRAVRRQRPPLVPRLRRAGAVPQPCPDQPADRPRQGGARGGGRLRPRDPGARRRDHRLRRQDARHRLRRHPRHVRRPEQRRATRGGQGRGLRARVHRADGHAGQEADLAQLVRVRRTLGVGQPAVGPVRRERRRRDLRQRVHPVGERARLPRHQEGDGLLRAVGVHAALHAPVRHAARGQARLPVRAVPARARGERHRRVPRRPGQVRRARRLAQPDLGAHRRALLRPDARPRRNA